LLGPWYDQILVTVFAVVFSLSSSAIDPLPVPPYIVLLLLKMSRSSTAMTWKPCSPPFHRSPVKVLVMPFSPSMTRTVAPVVRLIFVRQLLSRSEKISVSSVGEYSMLFRWHMAVPPCAVLALTSVVAVLLGVPFAGKILMSSQPLEPVV